MGYKDIAMPLAARCIPTIPLRPRTKECVLKNWQEIATIDLVQIEKWDQEYPDANCACVAQAKLGGFWYFEVDNKDVITRIEFETGHKIPATYTVRSSPGRGHIYFKQSAASIAMGNRQAKDGGKESWSARVDNRYVVAPNSIHPSGFIYETKSTFDIIEAPEWLINWLTSQKEDRPNTQEITGPVVEGNRNNYLTSYAGGLRAKGISAEDLEGILLRRNHESCNPPLPDDEVRTIAHSIGRYAPGPITGVVLMNGVPAGTKISESEPVEQKKIFIDTSLGATRPRFPYWVITGTTIGTGLVDPVVNTSSKHAEFLFLPAVQIMMNYLAGNVRIAFQEAKLNMFVGLISPYGQYFKSSSCSLAREYFKLVGVSNTYTRATKNAEGRVLIIQAGSAEGFGKSVAGVNGKKAILYNDELGKFAAKAGIESASFAQDVLSWYESDEFGNNIKSSKDSYSFEAGTYCFGWQWCTTDRGFNRHWPKLAGISSGLEDRMFFVISPEKPKPAAGFHDPVFTEASVETRKAIDEAITKGVYEFECKEEAQKYADGLDPRAMGLYYKLALYFAIDLKKGEIDAECLERAKAMVLYRNQAAAFLAPIEADNQAGRLQKEIVRELRQNGGRMKYRELCRALDYTRYGMDMWTQSYKSIAREGIIVEWTDTSDTGHSVRMVGIQKAEE